MVVDYTQRQITLGRELPVETADFTLPLRVYRLPFVRGLVNAKHPASFVVDTGGEMLSISKDVATQLAMRPSGHISLRVYGVMGVDRDAFVLPGVNLDFNEIQYQNFGVAVLNLRAPGVLLGFQVGGILGYSFLKDYRVAMDLARGELRLPRCNDRRLRPSSYDHDHIARLIAPRGFQAPAALGPNMRRSRHDFAEFDASAHVFLARVINVSPTDEDNHRVTGPLRAHTVQFEVFEDFKGTVGGAVTLAFDPMAADARLLHAGRDRAGLTRSARRSAACSSPGCSRTWRVPAGRSRVHHAPALADPAHRVGASRGMFTRAAVHPRSRLITRSASFP